LRGRESWEQEGGDTVQQDKPPGNGKQDERCQLRPIELGNVGRIGLARGIWNFSRHVDLLLPLLWLPPTSKYAIADLVEFKLFNFL
jgi:hypothetical protein